MGRRTKANLEANRRLKKLFIEKGITRCEVCGADNFLSFAHRHKRDWYSGDVEKLSDWEQVLLLCIPCHEKIEVSREKTEELFNKLRS